MGEDPSIAAAFRDRGPVQLRPRLGQSAARALSTGDSELVCCLSCPMGSDPELGPDVDALGFVLLSTHCRSMSCDGFGLVL